jgi:glycerol-3-phosphate acyltransferase PlsY
MLSFWRANFGTLFLYAILANMSSFWFLFFPLLGYLSGALPFSIWITRFVKQVDVRDAGSGHATTTNTIRQAGFAWGALVLILDISKGFLPTFLALKLTNNPWVTAITAACAVAGHCWPLFAQFRGGMGLATFGGSLLAVNWLAMLLGLGLLIVLLLTTRHGARASVFTGILISPLFWILHLRGMELWIAIACGIVVAYRFLIDWNRTYRELWLDREKQ